MNVIGSGVVVNIKDFFNELEALESTGLHNVRERIVISDRCHVVLDLHQMVDGLEEAELQGKSLGTTRKGISPTYQTKAARNGIRVSDIFNKELFDDKVRNLARGLKKRYGDLLTYDPEEEIERYNGYRAQLGVFVCDVVLLINDAQSKNVPLLVEGANALLLDIDYGSYPAIRYKLKYWSRRYVNCVLKAYTTRVGSGPFPSEDTGEVGDRLQTIGSEFGVTTKRKRRCGWLDLVVLRYSTAINHYTALNLTKLDVLDTFETIKIAIVYIHPETGEELPSFPADLDLLSKVKIVYHEMPGWNKPITAAKSFYDLPQAARDYVVVLYLYFFSLFRFMPRLMLFTLQKEYIEQFIGVKIKYIGNGPSRSSMIMR